MSLSTKIAALAARVGLEIKTRFAALATVATSGSYADLINKPTIPTVPTNVSAFNNDAGYITSASGFIESDPVFVASPAHGIASGDISNWNAAYGWGNHASAGYLTSAAAASAYQPLDADLTSIAGLTGTTGLLKKTALNTWVLDTNTYLTGITGSQVTTALGYTPLNSSSRGVANGVASLDTSGLVPSSQLPSFVDDVLEYANFASLPATGESGKIYVLATPYTSGGITSSQWRWSGSAYAAIIASPGSTDAVTEGSVNLYFTQARVRAAISASQNLSYNPTTGAFTGPDLSGYLTSTAAGLAYQPLDADLTSIAGLTGANGLLKKTALNTWVLDTSTYLTSYTETDPVFNASAAKNISTTNITNWNTAYGWGDHASAGYLTAITGAQVTGALGYTPLNSSSRGMANGVASLDASGLVPSSQLPSFVDDVLQYANFAALPATGESGKIYVLATPYTSGGITSSQWRWSGSAYAAIVASPGSTDAVTEGSVNLYFTQDRAADAAFPSGTKMLFAQTAAPTGWTKDITNYNNSALRVVTGTASSGGTVDFTTAFASKTVSGSVSSSFSAGSAASTIATGSISSTTETGTVGATTLATTQIPSHAHTATSQSNYVGGGAGGTGADIQQVTGGGYRYFNVPINTGGGTSHTHSLTMDAHTHTFSGTGHTHTVSGSVSSSFSGTAINLAVKYLDVILATKN